MSRLLSRRLHLFEWEDQPWLPTFLRDYITDHLRWRLRAPRQQPINLVIAKLLRQVLQASDNRQIVDLCSGAGGPLPQIREILAQRLQLPVDVVFTDAHPNAAAFAELSRAGWARCIGEPTDAAGVPPALKGVRTVFTAFHHFRPEQARRVLADAGRSGAPIAIFEPQERAPRMLLVAALDSLLRGLLLTPVVGRPGILRLVFTYAVPLAPLALAWDAVVSVLRSYTPEELSELARAAVPSGYSWKAGRFEPSGTLGLQPTVYLIGVPVAATAPA